MTYIKRELKSALFIATNLKTKTLFTDFPISLNIFGAKLSIHLLCEVMAFFLGFRYYLYLRKKKGDQINSSNRLWIFIGATLGALVFSRLIGTLEKPQEFWASEYKFLYFYSAKTIVGGLLGGLSFVELTKKMLKEKTSSGDLFTFPLILGMCIGRVGCLSAGIYEETYGLPSSLPWAMYLGDSIKRHPVALYEIVFLLLVWMVLVQVEKKYSFQNGVRFKLFLIAYLLFRFLLDFIKPTTTTFLGLSTIQLTCLLGLLYYANSIFAIIFKPKLIMNHEK